MTCMYPHHSYMNMLVETDDNDVIAVSPAGEELERVAGWNHAQPFRHFEVAVSALASRHNAASFMNADGTQGPTIHGYLVEQEALHGKAAHDRSTDRGL